MSRTGQHSQLGRRATIIEVLTPTRVYLFLLNCVTQETSMVVLITVSPVAPRSLHKDERFGRLRSDLGTERLFHLLPARRDTFPSLRVEKRMYACPLHDSARRKRIQKDGGSFRKGEVDVKFFWNKLLPPGESKKRKSAVQP